MTQFINTQHGKGNRATFFIFKKILLVLILSAIYTSAYSQTMSIASFKIDEADQTANVSPTMKTDMNGEKCALIKIRTTQKGFTFDVGSLGITDTEWQNSQHPAEIWLYVPHGVKRISIQHPLFGSISDYDLGTNLKRGRTYVMDLTSDQVNTFVVDYENSQILEVDIFPHDAELQINGIKQSLDYNGHTSIPLSFGTFTYRVTANNYHTEESQITINDKENKQTLSVRLKQAFGYLDVKGTPESQGGELYIDNVKIGTIPITQFPLKSGMHSLSINQKLYLPYTENIAMTDSATMTITPILKPNYAEYDIIVDGDKDAQIYDNGELLGKGHWKGRLEAGVHTIEAKKISHTTVTQDINVEKDIPRKVSLAMPRPIYGTLEIKTSPSNATVYVDGNKVGKTDFINSQLLIGPHHITIALEGHKTEELDVNLKEGETERINKTLTDFCNATIYSNPTANITINGNLEGKTPYNINNVAGEYRIELSAYGYTKYSKTHHLDGTTKDMTITLHRNYTRANEFYLQAGYEIAPYSMMNFGLGFYISNFNFECNYIMGAAKGEKIYWNDKTGETVPFSATYKPSGGNVKLGCGIRMNSRMRLTPQAGFQFITLTETIEENFAADNYTQWSTSSMGAAKGSKAGSVSFGARFNLAFAPCLGLSITPEYLFCVGKSNGFKALSNVSKQIKGCTEGFGCNISLNLFL